MRLPHNAAVVLVAALTQPHSIGHLRRSAFVVGSGAAPDLSREDHHIESPQPSQPPPHHHHLERVLLSEEGGAIGKGWAEAVEEDAVALMTAAGLEDNEQLSLTLCDDATIHSLNKEWRAVDRPTDVLSFPMEDENLLGDLVVSLDTAQRQADERGHELRDELRVLLVHGLLHLLG